MYLKVISIIRHLILAMISVNALAEGDVVQDTEINERLINAFIHRCGTESMDMLGYPDLYLNPNDLASCEIAFVIDPSRSKQYKTLLAAQSLKKFISHGTDLYEANSIINNQFKKQHQKEPTDVDLALAGYPESFYKLLAEKTPLSAEQLVTMEQLIGNRTTELLFGPITKLDYKLSETDLMNAVEDTLFLAQYMSEYVLGITTQNIRMALARSYENTSVSITYLSMPVRLRKGLLALASITTSFSSEELAVMRALQFSNLEQINYHHTGTQRSFSQDMQEYWSAEFIWRSLSIKDAKLGGISSEPAIKMLEQLRSLIQRKPRQFEQYVKYFPGIDYKKILATDTQSLREKYTEAIKNHSLSDLTEFEASLLIADFKYVATTNFREKDSDSDFYYYVSTKYLREKIPESEFDYINAIHSDNPFVVDHLNQHVNPLIELAFKTRLQGHSDWHQLSVGVDDLIQRISKNIDTICEQYSDAICDRMWRNIDLGDFSILPGSKTSIDCNIIPIVKPILERQLRARHLDRSLASCDLELAAKIFRHSVEEWVAVLTKTASSGQGTHELFSNRHFLGFGVTGHLAKHIYTAYDDKRISPVSEFDVWTPILVGSYEWAHYYQISKNQMPKNKKTDRISRKIQYQAFATIYSMMGNHERALVSQNKYLEILRHLPTMWSFVEDPYAPIEWLISLSRLKHYARNAGIPEAYVDALIDKYRIYIIENLINHVNKHPPMQEDIAYEAIKEFLNESNLRSILPSLADLASDEHFSSMLGKILALNNADSDELCKDKEFQELVFSNNENSKFIHLRDILLMKTAETRLYFEYVYFDAKCRLAGYRANKISQPDELSMANFNAIIDREFIPFIQGSGSFTDPRYSDTFAMISEYSRVSDSAMGLVFSLVATKHSFELMAEAFIFRNSVTWRLKMSDIETVLVNTTKAIKDAQNDNKEQTAVYSRLMRRTESLAASAHSIFVSDRTRARLLDVENKTFTETAGITLITNNTIAYNKMTEYFHKARTSLAESKTISEAIVNKARFSEHGIHAIPRFYKAATQIEKAITSPKKVFPTSNNSVLLNILSNGKHLYFQLLDDKGRYLSDTIDIQASLANRLKDRITRNARITTDDVNLGCEAFAEVHHVLKPLIKDYRQLVVVPSVNLLPIPTEIIIGTACDTSDATIIHAADILAAIELMRSNKDIGFPQSFVGIGNPSLPLESNQIKIAAVDGGSREIVRNLSAIDEFQPLPDAEEEILEIAEIFDDTSIFTATEGSIKKGLEVAQFNRQKGKNSAIVLATHGVGLDLGQGFELPSLLSVEDGRPTLIGATAVQQFNLEGSIVVLSACDTAAGLYEKSEMMFTGFVESFADAQSSFIVASLLPVRSQASKQHSVAFFRALKKGDIWQAVRAGKEALSNVTDSLPFVYIYP